MSIPKIVFDADAARFLSTLTEMKKSLLDNGDQVSRTKAKIVESMQQQTEAAVKAGKSQDELVRIQERGADRLASVTEKSAAKQEAALDRLIAKHKAVQAQLDQLGRIQVEGAGHGFTDRMAVSAVVRAGEGTPGIRSMENALTLIPGLASAAQGLAPLIGFAGLAGLFVTMGDKGYEAFEKIMHAAQDTRRAFDELHGKAQVSIDDLEIQNQKIQDQIDKISGHPNNGMATALLEAKKRADELLVSLQNDRKELEALFKEHSVGAFGSFLLGMKGTGEQQKNILNDSKAMEDELRKAKTPQDRQAIFSKYDASYAREEKRQQEIQAAKQKALEESQNHASAGAMGGYGGGAPIGVAGAGDFSDSIAQIQGFRSMIQDRATMDKLGEDAAKGQGVLGGLKQGKSAEELARAAAEKQMKAIDASAAELKEKFADNHAELLGAEAAFWDKMAHAPDIMAQNHTQVNDHFASAEQAYNSALIEMANKAVEQQKQAAEKQQKAQLGTWDMMHGVWETGARRSAQDQADFWSIRILEAEKGSANEKHSWDEYIRWTLTAQKELEDAQNRADQAQLNRARNNGRVDEAGLKLAQRQGQISPYSAAVQQANINSQTHDAEQAALDKQLADAQKAADPRAIFAAQQAQEKLAADRVIQIQEDAANIVGTTWQGALSNSLSLWVQDAEDSAKQVSQIMLQAIDGINNNLASALTDKRKPGQSMGQQLRNGLGDTARGLGKTVVGDGLKHLEATGLKALRIAGKADGSKANPFYVIDAGAGGLAGGGSVLKGLGSLFSGSGGSSGGDASGATSGGSKVIGAFASIAKIFFGGGMAIGGDVHPGVAYDVGEMGRERFIPKVAGTIIPNNQLGGSGTYYTIHVANGVTPQQMDMRVRQALTEYHPHGVRAAVKAVHDNKRRGTSAG